jgi:hypothetical protein
MGEVRKPIDSKLNDVSAICEKTLKSVRYLPAFRTNFQPHPIRQKVKEGFLKKRS